MMNSIKKIVINSASDNTFVSLLNLNNKRRGRKVGVTVHEDGLFRVSDVDGAEIYTPRRSRVGRYFSGVKFQCEGLSRQYLLNNIQFEKGDVLIDCGANNGEIGVWAQEKGLQYFAFEPEEKEARCNDLNNYGGENKTVRKALWNENTVLKFFSKPESADSSLIEITGAENVTEVQAITLDSFIAEQGIERVKLFKVEAEGAEPEVLLGALKSLNKIDYIAVECGYERGIDQQHTFLEVYKLLIDNDFEVVDAAFRRVMFLFKRNGSD